MAKIGDGRAQRNFTVLQVAALRLLYGCAIQMVQNSLEATLPEWYLIRKVDFVAVKKALEQIGRERPINKTLKYGSKVTKNVV